MDDGAALLEAILREPKEFTPRLAYADWLDGLDPPTDRQRATAEFIRLSCARSGTRGPDSPCSQWVRNNWARLVPSLFKYHRPHTSDPNRKWISAFQDASEICVQMRFEFTAGQRTTEVIQHVRLWLRCGFVDKCSVRSDRVRALVYAALNRDQPLWVMKRAQGPRKG